MSLSFIIKTNVSQATDVLIPDMGLVIISGVPLTLTKNRDLADARKSNDLKALCTDNAFGLNSTLILNDGIADIVNNDLIERFINDADISKSETGIIAVNASSTTLLTGGLISINATTFNVTTGTGLIVDNTTDTLNPTKVAISWLEMLNVETPYLLTDLNTYIGMDRNGIVLKNTPFSDIEKCSIVTLGWVDHFYMDGTINSYLSQADFRADHPVHFCQFADALGTFNIEGNNF